MGEQEEYKQAAFFADIDFAELGKASIQFAHRGLDVTNWHCETCGKVVYDGCPHECKGDKEQGQLMCK